MRFENYGRSGKSKRRGTTDTGRYRGRYKQRGTDRDTGPYCERMYCELAGGMDQNAATHLEKRFHVDNADMVVEKNITFYSMCEHHMLPFFGKAHVAYIPNGEVVGLSKIARTVEVFARRLQLQEQLTAQIADAFMDNLHPQGVMVMIEAEHLCMTMRGIKKPGAQTVTTVTRGVFDNNKELQDTFYQMVRL